MFFWAISGSTLICTVFIIIVKLHNEKFIINKIRFFIILKLIYKILILIYVKNFNHFYFIWLIFLLFLRINVTCISFYYSGWRENISHLIFTQFDVIDFKSNEERKVF